MIGRRAVLALAALAVLAGGCGREIADDRLAIAGWWMEDTARGIPRRSAELRLLPADPRLERMAAWTDRGTPSALANRRQRWDQLRVLFAAGEAVLPPEGGPGADAGLIAPSPAGRDAAAAAIIDAENQDRRVADIMAIERLALDAEGARAWRARIAAIRREADAAAGAVVWRPERP